MPIRILLASCFGSRQVLGFYSRTSSRSIAIVTPLFASPASSSAVLPLGSGLFEMQQSYKMWGNRYLGLPTRLPMFPWAVSSMPMRWLSQCNRSLEYSSFWNIPAFLWQQVSHDYT